MKKILFIHHSTGGLLLFFGKVRVLLRKKASHVELWDHSYNLYRYKFLSYLIGLFTFKTGLSDGNGKMVGKDFNINISNNSPKEYAEIFSRRMDDYTLKNILYFDTVIFKNCFPTSKIETIEKLNNYKEYYSQIMKNISSYKNRFIIFTQPPLRKEMNNPVWARNARKLANFMSLETRKYKNIFIFDFFNFLADRNGDNKDMLKRDFCNLLPFDSHPNIKANKEIGRKLVRYLLKYS
ncbi:hypothetical protein M1328_03970 [Patescibacteria group bacterium]|nr:hypothetical protein [Patescibacteria group bacterium]